MESLLEAANKRRRLEGGEREETFAAPATATAQQLQGLTDGVNALQGEISRGYRLLSLQNCD